MKLRVEFMADLLKSEDLGLYTVEADRIKAELRLKTKLTHMAIVSSGEDWYVADVRFFTDRQFRGDEEGFSVTAHYSSNVLQEIFARMKAAESGFEELLRDRNLFSYDWKEHREIMRCILQLEDKTRHLYDERRKAAEERNLIVYGTRYLKREL